MTDILSEEPAAPENPCDEAPPPAAPEPVRYTFTFEGTGSEYFRIWIVNVFLAIITLGIYAAWAKVRTRRYFYSNTFLADRPFEFLGDPVKILKGNLIIGAGLILYYVFRNFLPVYTVFVVAAFYIVLPFLIHKSLRFNAWNTAYRNIRFHFLGSLPESYKVYLFWPLLLLPTLGLIFPYWSFRKKKYFFHNLAYGTTQNTFDGRPGQFYRAYVLVFLAYPAVMIFATFFLTTFIPLGEGKIFETGSFFLFPLLGLLLYLFLSQYLFVRLNNYCLTRSRMDAVTFESTMWTGGLVWIYLTSILAIVFSLGLLIPWAKVRRTRYILTNITMVTAHGLDDFAAAAEGDVTALGDSATDVFDLAIGL